MVRLPENKHRVYLGKKSIFSVPGMRIQDSEGTEQLGHSSRRPPETDKISLLINTKLLKITEAVPIIWPKPTPRKPGTIFHTWGISSLNIGF